MRGASANVLATRGGQTFVHFERTGAHDPDHNLVAVLKSQSVAAAAVAMTRLCSARLSPACTFFQWLERTH